MKILKENIKLIIVFFIGAFLTGGAIFAYSYYAEDIKYEKSDGTEVSVKEALNELYNVAENIETSNNDDTNGEICEVEGTNNKKYRMIDLFTTNQNTGYVPTLTSDNSSPLGVASSNLGNAWYAFNGDSSNYVMYNSENIATGYVQFYSAQVLMKIGKITAYIGAANKTYNWYLQYYNLSTNSWVTVNSGTINDYYWNGTKVEGELAEPVYTTAFRVYTDTKKTSGNNFSVHSLQAYP